MVGAAHAEQVVFGVFDPPDHGQVDVDDIFVAGQHMALGKCTGNVGNPAAFGHPEVNAPFLGHAYFFHRLNRVGQMVVQSRFGGVDIFAESQHHPLFVGLHLIEAGCQPQGRRRADNQFGAAVKTETAAFFDPAEFNDFFRIRFALPRGIIAVVPRAFVVSHVFTPHCLLYCIKSIYNINVS